MRRILAVVLILIVVCIVFSTAILTAAGRFFIESDEPHKTDALIVLAGGHSGDRVMKACELVRAGYVSKAWVSGPNIFYGQSEASFAIDFATRHGCDRSWFEAFPNHCGSTRDEAIFFGEILKQRGVKGYTVVTSTYHTYRAGQIFRKEIPDIPMSIIAANDEFYAANSWWKTRGGRKLFILEVMKSITSPFGI